MSLYRGSSTGLATTAHVTVVGTVNDARMGSRMAANLQAAGHSLRVHNRSRDKAAPLVARGAVWNLRFPLRGKMRRLLCEMTEYDAPRAMRLPLTTASELSDLARISGWRTGTFNTAG